MAAVLAAVAGVTGAAATAAVDRLHAELHMGPNSEAKCRAFRHVMTDTQALQRAHGGALPTAARLRLQAELARARAKPPASLTPARCGLPL